MTMREKFHRRNRKDDRKEIRRRLKLAQRIRSGNVVTLETLQRDQDAAA